MSYQDKVHFKRELLKLAHHLDTDRFEILDAGLGLGKVSSNSQLDPAGHSIKYEERSEPQAQITAPRQQVVASPLKKSAVVSVNAHSSRSLGRATWVERFTLRVFGHFVDLMLVGMVLAIIIMSVQWLLMPMTAEPFLIRIGKLAESLVADWSGLVGLSDGIVLLYGAYVIYAILLKVSAGTTIGHFLLREKTAK